MFVSLDVGGIYGTTDPSELNLCMNRIQRLQVALNFNLSHFELSTHIKFVFVRK